MKTIQGIDSCTILINDCEYNQTHLNKYYQENNLSQIYSTEIKEPDMFIYHFNQDYNITPITIKSYWTTGKVEAYGPCKVTNVTYRVFEFIGLKSHNKKRDMQHQILFNNFISMLNNVDTFIYRITRVDIFNDYYTENKSIQNFFLARISKKGLQKPLNQPLNYHEETAFYAEDTSIKNPSLRTLIYDKSFKEQLKEKYIIRLEVSIRNIGVKINNYEALRDLINERVSYYQLFYFESIDDCNTIKTTYKNVMNKETKLSDKTLNKIKKFNGQEIDLSINKKTHSIISQFYHDEAK